MFWGDDLQPNALSDAPLRCAHLVSGSDVGLGIDVGESSRGSRLRRWLDFDLSSGSSEESGFLHLGLEMGYTYIEGLGTIAFEQRIEEETLSFSRLAWSGRSWVRSRWR